MENGQQQAPKKFGSARLLVIVVILAAVLGAAWYTYSKAHKPSSSKTNTASGWSEYTDQKYGFRFTYLDAWGKPKVSVISPSKNQSGSFYSISFPNITVKDTGVVVSAPSSDYSLKVCHADGSCGTVPAITKDVIENMLKQPKVKILKSDSSSFTGIDYQSGQATLYIDQVVSLPNIKVSAATFVLTLRNASAKCPQDKLATDQSLNCINEADYNNLNQLAKSLASI